jgi:phage terminase Nu1 subunit (DNA packaging protein)
VTRPVLAKLLAMSVRQVSVLESSGVLTPHARGRGGRATQFDVLACVPAYLRFMQQQARAGDTLSDARKRATQARAALLELRHARESGAVIPADVATREAFNFARIVRENCLNVPSRLSTQLAAESDPQRVFSALDGEIRQALSTTADLIASSTSHG